MTKEESLELVLSLRDTVPADAIDGAIQWLEQTFDKLPPSDIGRDGVCGEIALSYSNGRNAVTVLVRSPSQFTTGFVMSGRPDVITMLTTPPDIEKIKEYIER